MIKLPAGLQFQRFPRVVAYAMLAALVTSVLLAADGAYRWYHDASTQLATPTAREQSAQTPEPAPAETQHVGSSSQVPMPGQEVVATEGRGEDRPAAGRASNPASVSVPIPVARPIPGNATGPVAHEAAPQHTQPNASQQPKRQQVRRPPAKQEARDRTAPRQPAQAEKPPAQTERPNVYWERDTQLGFAPQLRKRTCNPATGQMPMQC